MQILMADYARLDSFIRGNGGIRATGELTKALYRFTTSPCPPRHAAWRIFTFVNLVLYHAAFYPKL